MNDDVVQTGIRRFLPGGRRDPGSSRGTSSGANPFSAAMREPLRATTIINSSSQSLAQQHHHQSAPSSSKQPVLFDLLAPAPPPVTAQASSRRRQIAPPPPTLPGSQQQQQQQQQKKRGQGVKRPRAGAHAVGSAPPLQHLLQPLRTGGTRQSAGEQVVVRRVDEEFNYWDDGGGEMVSAAACMGWRLHGQVAWMAGLRSHATRPRRPFSASSWLSALYFCKNQPHTLYA